MAIGVKRGFGGGGAKPKQIFLYKNGTDNTELTGGLSQSGYTFQSNYTLDGTVTFESKSIKLECANATTRAVMFGTTSLVNLKEVRSIVFKYHVPNGETQTATIDTSNIDGNHYVSFSLSNNSNNTKEICGFITTTKSYVSTNKVAFTSFISVGSLEVHVDSIELVPYETMPDNIIVDSNQQFNHKYTLQGNASIENAGVVFTRPQGTALNTGYILGIDFTNINSLTMSYTSGSSVYIRLNGVTLATINSGASSALILDVSEYSGVIPFEVVVNNYASFYITTLIAS